MWSQVDENEPRPIPWNVGMPERKGWSYSCAERNASNTDQEPEWCHGFSVRRKLEDGRAAPLWFSVKLSPNSVDKLWFKNEGSIKMFSDVQGPKPLPFAQKGFSTRETIDSHGLFPKLRQREFGTPVQIELRKLQESFLLEEEMDNWHWIWGWMLMNL